MKPLATEASYFLNRIIAGCLLVPGILWSLNELLARYLTDTQTVSLMDYYLQFYSRLDSPLTWLWLLLPYLLFLLTRPRARVKTEKAQPSLHKVASRGRVEIVKVLIEEAAKVHATNVRGQSPLHLAAMTDNVKVVRMLIDGGADIDVTEPGNSIRPLHNAATNGCARVCEFLLKHGADMDAQTAQGDTALHLAAANRHVDTVSLLLSFHANHALGNHAGVTAEQIATARGYEDIVELIRQHSSNEWPYPRLAYSNSR
ncbi:MAG: ankyrin repeat domain-containing protein [Gammaproteobacteria bacterium]